jgi:hypothetical protein
MKRWRNDSMKKMAGWMIFLALLFSCVFASESMGAGCRCTRARSGFPQGAAVSASAVSHSIDVAEAETLGEKEEAERLHEAFLFSLIKRLPVVLTSPFTARALVCDGPSVGLVPVRCPLRI